jgi:hypothetical protein
MKNIDVPSLLEEARISEHSESYMVLEKNEDIRIGAVARTTPEETPALFLEVDVVLNPGEAVDLDTLNRKITFLKELVARGYVMSCQDGSTICSEVPTTEHSILDDIKTIKTITNTHTFYSTTDLDVGGERI